MTEDEAKTKIQSDGESLIEWLKSYHPRTYFMVGAGSNNLHVYVQGSARKWDGEHTPIWNGTPVEWHFNVGPVKAGQAQ